MAGTPELGRLPDGKIGRRVPAALPDTVTVVVHLDRRTGRVDYDDEFSTPLETWGMLATATERASGRIDQANGFEGGD